MITRRKIRSRTLLYRIMSPMVLVLLFSISLHLTLSAQYQQAWDDLVGSDNFDEVLSVVEVSDGIVYGATATSSTMGDSPQTVGDADFWIYKTDFSGNIIWSYTYGGFGPDRTTNLIATQDGGFIMCGRSSSGIALPYKTEDSRGGDDVWLVKVDANGIFSWDATFGGDQEDQATSITQAEDGIRDRSPSRGLGDVYKRQLLGQ